MDRRFLNSIKKKLSLEARRLIVANNYNVVDIAINLNLNIESKERGIIEENHRLSISESNKDVV